MSSTFSIIRFRVTSSENTNNLLSLRNVMMMTIGLISVNGTGKILIAKATVVVWPNDAESAFWRVFIVLRAFG
jgi:hypothetical protein